MSSRLSFGPRGSIWSSSSENGSGPPSLECLGCQRPGRDQRERRAGLGPADRRGEQPYGAAIFQDRISEGLHRRFGATSVELCNDHHTLPPLLFVALPPVFGTLLLASLPGHQYQSFR